MGTVVDPVVIEAVRSRECFMEDSLVSSGVIWGHQVTADRFNPVAYMRSPLTFNPRRQSGFLVCTIRRDIPAGDWINDDQTGRDGRRSVDFTRNINNIKAPGSMMQPPQHTHPLPSRWTLLCPAVTLNQVSWSIIMSQCSSISPDWQTPSCPPAPWPHFLSGWGGGEREYRKWAGRGWLDVVLPGRGGADRLRLRLIRGDAVWRGVGLLRPVVLATKTTTNHQLTQQQQH